MRIAIFLDRGRSGVALVLIAVFVAAACSPAASATPSPTAFPTPTPTVVPSASIVINDPTVGLTIGPPYQLAALDPAAEASIRQQISGSIGSFGGLFDIGLRQVTANGAAAGIVMVMAFPSGVLSEATFEAALGGFQSSLGVTFTKSDVSGVTVSSATNTSAGYAAFQNGDNLVLVITPPGGQPDAIAQGLISPNPLPTSEATVEPTSEPTPDPTARPTPKPTPVPPVLKTSGRGDRVVKMAAQDEPTFARITGKGRSNFAVVSYAGSEYGDLLVNEIGAYSGTVYIAAGINRLKVSASGSWTIEVRPISSAPHWTGLVPLTGTGDRVVLLTDGASGIATVKNKGRSNFAVIAYSTDGEYLDLLVNEIGSYSGQVLLPDADPMVLTFHAAGGTWSMSPVEQ
jgi:hypothetical protein